MAVTKTDPTTSVPRTLRLNRAEWLCVAGLVLLVMCLTPRLWRRIEKTGFGENYRIPYESSKNYWMFTRWAEAAREAHAGVAIGDSAVVEALSRRRRDTASPARSSPESNRYCARSP